MFLSSPTTIRQKILKSDKIPIKLFLPLLKNSGAKLSKERVTIGICCNSTGTDKLKPLVIGKAKRPRCFGKVFQPSQLVYYTFNKKAWMTMVLFEEWLEYFNSRMKLSKRKVLLILDNAAGHNVEKEFSNVKLFFLPPNMTSVIQPCDAGIIKSFKVTIITLII